MHFWLIHPLAFKKLITYSARFSVKKENMSVRKSFSNCQKEILSVGQKKYFVQNKGRKVENVRQIWLI